MQIKEPQKSPKAEQNLVWAHGQLLLLLEAWVSVATAMRLGFGISAVHSSASPSCQQGHNSAEESSSASGAQTFIFVVDLCMMSPHSSCCLSAPWWNRCQNHLQSLKKTKNKKQRSWCVSGKSFLHHSKLPHKELLAEKLPNSAQGQLHFSGRDKLVEKQLKSHLCHKPTQQLHPFQDEWWIPYRNRFLNLKFLFRTVRGSETAG